MSKIKPSDIDIEATPYLDTSNPPNLFYRFSIYIGRKYEFIIDYKGKEGVEQLKKLSEVFKSSARELKKALKKDGMW